jgi:hypothetical protein
LKGCSLQLTGISHFLYDDECVGLMADC